MTRRQAQNIGAVLGTGRYRLIRYRDDDKGWGVVVPCNEHDPALWGCLVVDDGNVSHVIGVRADDYTPNTLYPEGAVSVALNYDEGPSDDGEPEEC